ncbi:Pentatricopeptide repeat (PPR) superfamily protein [Abeliophyllum distichum]|uniref:Pentatricopeptide repeat (PPR) superfamily protein n=1 Tax=Abeliophyllum distichum TaxID=126358 RepID=A0ABD1VZY9_9LAMI
MLMIEPSATAAVRFSAANHDSSTRLHSHSATFSISRRLSDNSGPCGRRNGKSQKYHPFEEIAESELTVNGEASLTPAETTRTIIEVNSKAMLMFSGFMSDEIHENIFWPDLPYVTDEHGNIYFQVKNDEDILQTLSAEENVVQVIIGLDTAEMITEIELLGHSEIDFGIDELDDEDSDIHDEEDDDNEDNDNYEKDWVGVLDDEEDLDEESNGSLEDWAKLETMRSSHPMDFAKKLADVVSYNPVEYMEQPSAGLAIQGLLRPALIEEHSVIPKHKSGNIAKEQMQETAVEINGHKPEKETMQGSPSLAEELEKDETLGNGTLFYKLEMIKIQLVSSHGHPNFVEIEDFLKAQPDAIVHSAAKIISRVKAGGEKTTQALKSLCWRCKGIQVEEVSLIGVDSLGFDMRICSGTQVQTLRFAFKKRASSEYSAERQLNDLLFPRVHKFQQKKESQQTES